MEGKTTEGPAKADREASWGFGGSTPVAGRMTEGSANADGEASWGFRRQPLLTEGRLEGQPMLMGRPARASGGQPMWEER